MKAIKQLYKRVTQTDILAVVALSLYVVLGICLIMFNRINDPTFILTGFAGLIIGALASRYL